MLSLSYHNRYYPFPSIERSGWYKSDDVLKAIWDHLFLNIMSCTLPSHCLLKVDTKFDYVCVTGAAFHSSHISHVWIVLLSCFNTLFTRCFLFVCLFLLYIFLLYFTYGVWTHTGVVWRRLRQPWSNLLCILSCLPQ